jgi:two-component system, NtrC family, nitrogen regulation response regulator NtrX
MTPSRPPKPTVLLIDDDQEVLDMLEECVEGIGYATVTAKTGAAGLAAVSADPPPDVVLLDIAMPGTLGGVDTLRAIKRSWPDLPVIMVTANVDEAIATTTLREGAFDYVMKPVHITRLREVLAAATVLSGKEPPP